MHGARAPKWNRLPSFSRPSDRTLGLCRLGTLRSRIVDFALPKSQRVGSIQSDATLRRLALLQNVSRPADSLRPSTFPPSRLFSSGLTTASRLLPSCHHAIRELGPNSSPHQIVQPVTETALLATSFPSSFFLYSPSSQTKLNCLARKTLPPTAPV
jgi:hypothetical protein